MNEKPKDHIEKRIHLEEEEAIICPSCFKCTKQNNRAECLLCGYNTKNLRNRESLYGDVPDHHPESKPVIEMGEIIGTNPNSFETIEVLKNILQQCSVGSVREWVRIGFDGVPYRIATKITETTALCSLCNTEMDLELFVDHQAKEHPSNTANAFNMFGRILLVPGAGHIEKNLLLALFKICRDVFLLVLADKLGFRTKNAKNFIINCGDHHLSWQILQIAYTAFASELLYEYVKVSREHNVVPTVNGLVEWRNANVKNPTYNLMYDLVFNIMLGFICFRSGIRRNNSQYALAGRQKVAPIMFIGRHAIYTSLLYNDMRIRVSAPEAVNDYIRRNESFSRSGNHYCGEGGDYITETENKHLKSHLPPGVPTLHSWIMASRNHKFLNANRSTVYTRSGVADPANQKSSIFNFELEVQMFRSVIRESGMLSKPEEECPLRSLEGDILHHDLVNFYFTAQENYLRFLDDQSSDLQPVFITHNDEREFFDVNNWTVQKIIEACQTKIMELSDMNLINKFDSVLSAMKNPKKQAVITLYNEICMTLDNDCVANTVQEE